MNKNNIAIKVSSVSKTFKLPHEKQTSIKSLFVNLFSGKRTYEKQQVLKDVTFEIKKGEFFGIVGRNGSGKSTLLKLLAGIYSPDNGTVNINGRLTPFIELGVGFNPELTGRENIYLNGALLGFSRKEMDEMYGEIVDFAELHHFMDQKLKNYSSGMQVRLAFSIAIRARSDILLIDEVLAVGDAVFQSKCYEYFAQLKSKGITVVFVSHDNEALLRFCDKGILVNKGKILYEGPIRKVVNEYKAQLLPVRSDQNDKNSKSKVAEVLSVQLTDDNGKPIKKVNSGSTVNVKVTLKNKKVNPELINVAIGIYDGLYGPGTNSIFGASTQLDGKSLDVNSQEITLTIESLKVKNGIYYVYVSVFGQSEELPYDYIPEALTFTVDDARQTTARGTILATHMWRSK